MNKNKQSYKFFLTFNSPQEYDYDYTKIKKILYEEFPTFQYACMCSEKGSNLHYHVFISFTSRVRWNTVQKRFPHVDIRIAKGSVGQCVSYIKKDGKWESKEDKQHTVIKGTFEEFGDRPKEVPKSINHAELLEMIRNGVSNAEILEINPEFAKEITILDKLRYDILTHEKGGKIRLNLEVTYIFGDTGTGKSRYIWEHFSDEVCVITNYKGNGTFDGLKPTHDVLVFEEFRDSIKLKDMLNYCDIYPISAPSRYADKPIFATKIFIISNWKFEKQYSEEQIIDQEPKFDKEKETKLYANDSVILYIPEVDVYPDMVKEKWTLSKVQDFAKENNLTLDITYKETTDVEENIVLSQGRDPGDPIYNGYTLKITISKKPEDKTEPTDSLMPKDDKKDKKTE